MTTQIQVKRDTATNWTAADPVLAAGEFGYETDTGTLKIGDGITAWSSLADLGGSSGGVSAGAILATKTYTTSTTYTATGTIADVDATNLAVTFTVPASGQVLIDLEGLGDATSAGPLNWGLREGTTTIAEATATALSYHRCKVSFLITGLTPGAVKTYKWAFRRLGSTGSPKIYTGGAAGTNGNVLMIVRAL